MKKAKPALVLFLKMLVSVGLLGYFLTRIHIERFVSDFRDRGVFLYRNSASGLSGVASGQRHALDGAGAATGL